MRRLSFGGLALPVAFAIVATLLWLLGDLLKEDPILGEDRAQAAFQVAAVVLGTAAATLLTGHLLISVLFDRAPTGFQQAVVYGVLTFVTSAFLLAHYGFDLRAILTTSAIVTAVVGLAMQPTLGTVISGLTVHATNVVRVDDGVVHEGEIARITALTWRSVVARKNSGAVVVFPNSRVADHVTEIVRHDRSLRVHTYFQAPIDVPPERIGGLVVQMVSDFAAVDPSRSVIVAPNAYEPDRGSIKYRITYNIRNFDERGDLEDEVLRRLWYVFQRNGIAIPTNRLFVPARHVTAPIDAFQLASRISDALERGGSVALKLSDTEQSSATLCAEARLLLYAPDERLILPETTAGSAYLLVRGETVKSHEFGSNEAELGRPVLPAFRLGPDATVRRIADRLAADIGPYAEFVVWRAAEGAANLVELCRTVAREIDDPAKRAKFLVDVEPAEQTLRYGPGLVFHGRRNAAGDLVSHLALRAQTEVAVLAISPDLLARTRMPNSRDQDALPSANRNEGELPANRNSG